MTAPTSPVIGFAAEAWPPTWLCQALSEAGYRTTIWDDVSAETPAGLVAVVCRPPRLAEARHWVVRHTVRGAAPALIVWAEGVSELVELSDNRADFSLLVGPWHREAALALFTGTASASGDGMRLRAEFAFRSLEEARIVTDFVSTYCALEERVAIGLLELLVNAVEHGNLGLGFEEKSRLQRNAEWEQEVCARMNDPRASHGALSRRLTRGEKPDVATVANFRSLAT